MISISLSTLPTPSSSPHSQSFRIKIDKQVLILEVTSWADQDMVNLFCTLIFFQYIANILKLEISQKATEKKAVLQIVFQHGLSRLRTFLFKWNPLCLFISPNHFCSMIPICLASYDVIGQLIYLKFWDSPIKITSPLP